MKSLPAALCGVLLVASIGHADVRYTTHAEVRRTTAAKPTRLGDVGALQALLEPGDAVIYVGTDSVRIEQVQGATKSVVLLRPDGQFVLDPDARTYSRLEELGEAFKVAGSLAPSTFTRTGEFDTILGIRAERIELTISTPLPIIPPPGFPTVVTMKGNVWLGALPGPHAAGLRKATGFMKTLPADLEGIALRQIMRSDEFGYEVETIVTELVEAPIPAEMFSVPADYREQKAGSRPWR